MAPRMRKTPKPKKPSYERIDRKVDSIGVYDVLDDCLKRFRKDLTDEKCQIALAWRYGLKPNKDGQLVLGRCRKVSELDKQYAGFDFIIILNREAWEKLAPEQRVALMHHELCHAGISTDANGNTKKDARERTMFRIRKHDIEEFGDVVAVHGCYKSDLADFVLAAVKSPHPPQPAIPGLAEPSSNGKHEHVTEGGEVIPAPVAARMRRKPPTRSKAK